MGPGVCRNHPLLGSAAAPVLGRLSPSFAGRSCLADGRRSHPRCPSRGVVMPGSPLVSASQLSHAPRKLEEGHDGIPVGPLFCVYAQRKRPRDARVASGAMATRMEVLMQDERTDPMTTETAEMFMRQRDNLAAGLRNCEGEVTALRAERDSLRTAGDRLAAEVEARWSEPGTCDCDVCTAARAWRIVRKP